MTEPVVTAAPERTVREIAEPMRERNVGSVVLVDGANPSASSPTAISPWFVIADGRDFGDHVADHASSPVITAEAGMDVEEAGELMVRHAIRYFVVVDGGRLTGIVTLRRPRVADWRRRARQPAGRPRHARRDAGLLLPRARRPLASLSWKVSEASSTIPIFSGCRTWPSRWPTQNLAWADNAIKLAVDMTVAAINRVNLQGNAEEQAKQVRSG